MKQILLSAAIFVLLLAGACKKSAVLPADDLSESEKMATYLAETYGFKPEDIQELPDGFLVEGDQMFTKENFWEEYSILNAAEFLVAPRHAPDAPVERKHYRYTYLINQVNYKTIKVNIDYYVPQVWRDAIVKAVQEWNAADGYFNFEVTYYNYSVNGAINIKMNNSIGVGGDLVVATAYYPSSTGKPGSPVYINSNYNSLPYWKKVFAMVHEIGHAIGIRHTDSGQGSLIDGVGECMYYGDPGSVMQPYLREYWGMTDCDKEAYLELYGPSWYVP